MKKINVFLILLLFFSGCATKTTVVFTDGTEMQTAIVTGTKASVKIDMKEKKMEINQIGLSPLDKVKGLLPPVKVDK